MVIDFLTAWHRSCYKIIEEKRGEQSQTTSNRWPPAVTGVSEQTKFEVDCGARKFSRNCGRLRTNHGEYPFRR